MQTNPKLLSAKRKKTRRGFLIATVFRIFSAADFLRKIGAAHKKNNQQQTAGHTPVKNRATCRNTEKIKANPNDVCVGPSVSIKNNTNITQSVNVRIYGGPVKDVYKTISIPGNSSRSISTLAAGIKQTKRSRVYVEAGSFKLSKEITFIPFE